MKLKATCRIIGIYHDRDVMPKEIFEPRSNEQGEEMIAAGIAVAFSGEEVDPVETDEEVDPVETGEAG